MGIWRGNFKLMDIKKMVETKVKGSKGVHMKMCVFLLLHVECLLNKLKNPCGAPLHFSYVRNRLKLENG